MENEVNDPVLKAFDHAVVHECERDYEVLVPEYGVTISVVTFKDMSMFEVKRTAYMSHLMTLDAQYHRSPVYETLN